MAFTMEDKETILARLRERINEALANSGIATFEGTFTNDVLAANSVEFEKVSAEMAMIVEAAFPQTSWGDYLTMLAEEYGVTRKTATKAVVTLKLSGTAGADVPSGSAFATTEGLIFITTADATIGTDGTITVAAEAQSTGEAYNVAASTITVIPVSIYGVSGVTNAAAATDGYDEEADSELLARYLLKVKTPATSGNVYHYQQWALSVSGVGQVKVLSLWNGNGTVKVIIINEDNEIASDTLIKSVADYIETVRPIGATVTVTTPTPLTVNVVATITGSGNADTIKSAINKYFKNEGFSISYVSIAKIGKILLDNGVTDYSNLTINGSTANITLSDNELPVVGSVTLNVAS